MTEKTYYLITLCLYVGKDTIRPLSFQESEGNRGNMTFSSFAGSESFSSFSFLSEVKDTTFGQRHKKEVLNLISLFK